MIRCRGHRLLYHRLRRHFPSPAFWARRRLRARGRRRKARMQKRLVVLFSLVGIVDSEIADCLNKSIRVTDVAGERDRVTRARVTSYEQFAADLSVLGQAFPLQVLKLDRTLVIVELANKVLAIVDCGPTEKHVREELHRPLTLCHAPALVLRLPNLAQVRSICRSRLLFY